MCPLVNHSPLEDTCIADIRHRLESTSIYDRNFGTREAGPAKYKEFAGAIVQEQLAARDRG
ncbi:MAG: hypothetical protein NVS2B16_29700 [Chloroflexota bacterium]